MVLVAWCRGRLFGLPVGQECATDGMKTMVVVANPQFRILNMEKEARATCQLCSEAASRQS